MGMAKRYFEKQMEEGWTSVGDKYTCDKCLPDYAVAKFVRENAESGKCSYCERRRPSAPMDDVLSFIAAGIHRRYEDPGNSVGYCSAEGGYNIAPTDGYDLFDDVLEDAGDEIREDLRTAFAATLWVRHDPYGLPPDQAMNHVWGAFSQLVMHGRRYSFREVAASDDDRMDYGHAKPSDILDTIGGSSRRLD